MFKNPRIKAAPKQIRVEQAPAVKKPAPLPSKIAEASRKQQIARSAASSARSSPAISNARSSPATSPSEGYETSARLKVPKRKQARQASPADRPKFDSDDDDEDSTSSEQPAQKRQKLQGSVVDPKRQIRSRKAFSETDGGKFEMIHAADIAAEVAAKAKKSKAVVDVEIDTVELQYPSASQRERYDLFFSKRPPKDRIYSVDEIIKIAKTVSDIYLTEEQAEPFRLDENGRFIRELERAKNTSDTEGFKKAVKDYNTALGRLIQDGVLAKNLDERHDLPLAMVQLILCQVYERAVSPDVDSLRQYEAGSDNVYGELLSPLVDRILIETKLTSDQVFVDLGSGVGNVVLQAALQVGCESWGCEMATNACKLARAQKKEFAARCRLWGIATGKVRLEEGDFLENSAVKDAVKRADVILVNNEVFSSDLNQKLMDLFLDCKDGCRIVSLKSFFQEDLRMASWNISNPAHKYDLKKFQYYGDDVSWTGAGGNYYIATKDEQRVARFLEQRNE